MRRSFLKQQQLHYLVLHLIFNNQDREKRWFHGITRLKRSTSFIGTPTAMEHTKGTFAQIPLKDNGDCNGRVLPQTVNDVGCFVSIYPLECFPMDDFRCAPKGVVQAKFGLFFSRQAGKLLLYCFQNADCCQVGL